MRSRLLLIWATMLLFAVSCASPRAKYRESVIYLETTPCFGMCPVYELTIFGNGDAVVHNKANMDSLGMYTAKLDGEVVDELFGYFKKQDWNEFKDEYPTYVSDLPAKIISFDHKRISKSIVINGGSEHPAQLDSLITRVQSIRTSVNWVGQDR